MSTEQGASIVRLARQLSQSCSELFEHLGEDLDRKMGAALGVKPDHDASLRPQPPRSTIHAADGDKPSVSAKPEVLKSKPHLSEEHS
jgi:hypothetical protein